MPKLPFAFTFLAVSAIVLSLGGCVQSQYVPAVGFVSPTPILVTPTPSPPPPGAPPILLNPNSLTLSVTGAQPPFASTSTVTVSQPTANQPPFVIVSQSTCLTGNNLVIVSSSSAGATSVYQMRATTVGQCVLVFGGIGGVTNSLPVTVNQ
ncbi:MAG: hypothetical protein JO359_00280 [Candidatus Eremiobacteraeota bacterium]|nr:hypothetical protein [Candidatus Eremiobacteraeota bacterium]